jgi:GrpB-like predicted nucleotidyltransferase (UPF0157 family)
MARTEDIVKHHDPDPDENPWVRGAPVREDIEVVPYRPEWPAMYRRLAGAIRRRLGSAALDVEHVGSTAVPGLAAKPVIDIDLTVADPRDEAVYVPPLEGLGYDLIIREPGWHQHRCLRLEAPMVNLHVFGPDCPETIRHRLFREWLHAHPEDRELYARAKAGAVEGAAVVMEYNLRKQPVIREIYERAFKAAGLA